MRDTWRSLRAFDNVEPRATTACAERRVPTMSESKGDATTDSATESNRSGRAQSAGNTRTLLMVVGPLTAAGIALAAVGDAAIGRWMVVIGAIGLIVALHRYGRLGADPPLDLGD